MKQFLEKIALNICKRSHQLNVTGEIIMKAFTLIFKNIIDYSIRVTP